MAKQKGNNFMVIVADSDDETSGDIAFFGSADESATHVESLLESGYEQARIGVFGIERLDTHVRHRPVVTIVRDGERLVGEQAPTAAAGE
jgi:hypothetical protein